MLLFLAVCATAQLAAISVAYKLTRASAPALRPLKIYIVVLAVTTGAAAAWAMATGAATERAIAYAMVALAACGLLDVGRSAIQRAIEANAECLVREALRSDIARKIR